MIHARQMIREVYERQINGRTPFRTSGFNTCDYNYHRQGPSHTLPPMIRIEFTKGKGVGSSGSIDGGNFPFTLGRTSACNIQLDYMRTSGGKGSTVFAPQDSSKIQATALHELLHMLGMQHEETAMEDKTRRAAMQDPNMYIVDPVDPQSVTRRLNTSTRLSSEDVRCLERIFNREILNFSAGRLGVEPATKAGAPEPAVDAGR